MKISLRPNTKEFHGYQGSPFSSINIEQDWADIHYEISLGMAKIYEMSFGRCPGDHPGHANILQPIDKVYSALSQEELDSIKDFNYQETVKYLYFRKNAYMPFYQCLYIVGDGVYGSLDYRSRTVHYSKLFPKTHALLNLLPLEELHRAVICVTYLNNAVPAHRIPATGDKQFIIRPIKKVKSYTYDALKDLKYHHDDSNITVMNPNDYYGVEAGPTIEWYILAEGK